MKNNALFTNDGDNVVIALADIAGGDPVVVDGHQLLTAAEDIRAGHKIARVPIAEGETVFRYGEPIVRATRAIAVGESVHVHNTEPIPGNLIESPQED